jgi:hypothetical protein
VAHPPRGVHVQGPPPGEKALPLAAEAEDPAIPPSEPEDLRHLFGLAVDRQLGHQQAVRNEYASIHSGPRQVAHPVEAVHHVAGGHFQDVEAEARPRIGDAKRIERPRLARQHFAGRADPSIERIREHDLRMAIERVNELLQPSWMPQVVIARPGEILGLGIHLPCDLERPPAVVDQAEPPRIGKISHAAIERLVLPRDVGRGVCRAVVHEHERKVRIRLAQDGFDRFAEVLRVIEQRRADNDSGRRHQIFTRRHPMTCL